MFSSKRAQYFFIFVLINYANAGMIQHFIQSLTGSHPTVQTPLSNPSLAKSKEEHHKGNTTLSSTSRNTEVIGWARGYSHHEPYHTNHHNYYHHDQNLDLYGLLSGLAFASLLGATIIFLATRNVTAGRKRRSLSDDENVLSSVSDAIDDPLWERTKVQPVRLY